MKNLLWNGASSGGIPDGSPPTGISDCISSKEPWISPGRIPERVSLGHSHLRVGTNWLFCHYRALSFATVVPYKHLEPGSVLHAWSTHIYVVKYLHQKDSRYQNKSMFSVISPNLFLEIKTKLKKLLHNIEAKWAYGKERLYCTFLRKYTIWEWIRKFIRKFLQNAFENSINNVENVFSDFLVTFLDNFNDKLFGNMFWYLFEIHLIFGVFTELFQKYYFRFSFSLWGFLQKFLW